MPKVSVIVYVKNTEKYIGQCLQSIIDQSEKDIEIIVVDGESTDGTLDIIQDYLSRDKRIKLFTKSGSVGAQFNYGLDKASGEYISVVEADDFVPSDMIEKQYCIATKYDIDIVKAGYYYYHEVNGKEMYYPFQACSNSELYSKIVEYHEGNMLNDVGMNGFWSGMYKKSFLDSNHVLMNETPGASYQDIGFSFLTQLYAKRVWYMDDCFYRYRIDNPNSSVNSKAGLNKHIQEYVNLRKTLESKKLWNDYKFQYFKFMALSFEWYLTQFPEEDVTEWIYDAFDFLSIQLKNDWDDLDGTSNDIKKTLEPIKNGRQTYFEYIKESLDINRNLMEYMSKKFDYDKEFVVFGVGNIGKDIISFLSANNKTIILVDNDKKKQNDLLNGYMVFSPEEICRSKKEAIYFVANTYHYSDIMEQLIEYSIQEESIVVCNDRGFWLRKIVPLF